MPATGNETGAPVPCDSRIQIFMAGVPRGVASRLAPIQPVGGKKKKKKKKNGGERKGEGKGRLRYRCPLIFLSFHPRKSFTGIIKGCHFAVIYILYITPSIVHEARSPVRYGKRLILGEPFPIIVRHDGNRGEREFSGEWKTRKWGGMLAFYSCTVSIPMI